MNVAQSWVAGAGARVLVVVMVEVVNDPNSSVQRSPAARKIRSERRQTCRRRTATK